MPEGDTSGGSGLAATLRSLLAAGPKPFERLYLETSFLVGADWPRGSQPLTNVTALCDMAGISVYLPEPIRLEAEAHWFREWIKKTSKGQAAQRAIVDYLRTLEWPQQQLPQQIAPPGVDDVISRYRAHAQRTSSAFRIQTSPFTQRSGEEIFRMAIKYQPPFQPDAEGKGFQDMINWLSIIDDVRLAGVSQAALLAVDQAFGNAAERLEQEAGIRITVVKSADGLTEMIMAHAAAAARQIYGAQREQAAAALNDDRHIVEDAVRQVDVSSLSVLLGKIISVKDINLPRNITADSVQPPFPGIPSPGDRVSIAFTIPGTAHVVVEQWQFPPEPPLKVGETRPGLFSLPAPFPGLVHVESDIAVTLVGEVQATYQGDRYTDPIVTQIRLA